MCACILCRYNNEDIGNNKNNINKDCSKEAKKQYKDPNHDDHETIAISFI